MKTYTVELKVTVPNGTSESLLLRAITTMLSIGIVDAQNTVNDPSYEPHTVAKLALRLRIADPVIVRVEGTRVG